MDKKISTAVTLVGIGLTLIYLPLGALYLFFSFSWVAIDIIFIGYGGGGNLTGLGIFVIDPLAMMLGSFFLNFPSHSF